MPPGLYVVRMPDRGMGQRLIIESICFQFKEGFDPDWVRQQADNWCDYIQSQHPKDDVFVIEKPLTPP